MLTSMMLDEWKDIMRKAVMPRRKTIQDVAREAGVSVATVDRVLTGRTKVREETARKVAEAARRIGYHAQGLIAQRLLPDVPKVRLGFVLHKERQEFYQNFAKEIKAAVDARTDVEARVVLKFSPSQSPEAFCESIDALADRVDAVASSAINHHTLSQLALNLKDRGIPIFALLNDFAQGIRESYLGLNNIRVGRIAAWMISVAVHQPGKIAVFVGGNRWHGHELRETGFRTFFREHAPAFRVLDTLVNLETRELTKEATLDLLRRHPDLKGIYVAGGGMEGAISALRESRPPGKVVLVVNEITSESRAALSERYVTMAIATPLDILCRDLVSLMIDVVLHGGSTVPGQHFLEPQIFLPESI
jgi:LacI family transcriptional regulator